MAVKMPFLCLLVLLLPTLSGAREQKCVQAASSCDRCIEAGPECAWCSAPSATTRCHTREGLQKAGCEDAYVFNPQGNVTVLKSEPSKEPVPSQTVFLEPQEVSVYVRPGEAQSFPLSITMPTDQSVTQLTLRTNDVPTGIQVSLSSTMQGNPVLVQMSVNASQCPSRNMNMTGPWTLSVETRYSIQRVKLHVHLQCHCDCSLKREENSPVCNNRGALVCGHCECNQAYEGSHCETDKDPSFLTDDRLCRQNSMAPLCSNRGTCVEGSCECSRRIEPKEQYSGNFCECNNFNCPYSNRRLCAGNGRCVCGTCACDEGWKGEGCDCNSNVTSCLAANMQLCNGRGTCECGVCKCTDPNYQGVTCEICPTCPGMCVKLEACVECRAFGLGKLMASCDTECSYFSMTLVDTADDLPDIGAVTSCKMVNKDDNCFFYYTYQRTPNGENVTVVRTRHCPSH